jgi:hypothetical protein
MKYLIWILIIGAGYYHFSKMQLWTDVTLVQGIAHNDDKYCSDPEILKNYGITKEKCMNAYALSLPVCAAQAEKKFPGEEYESQEDFVESGDDIISCINNALKKQL